MCSVCFRGYESTHELKRHMAVHSLKRFKCPTCRSTYSNRSSLIRHQKTAHSATSGNTDNTVCGHCGKHRGPGHMCYTCTECTAQFRTKEGFTAHECTKTRVYSCPYCSEQFTRRSGVLNHIMNEENKRKFHCGQCGMRFNTSGSNFWSLFRPPYPCLFQPRFIFLTPFYAIKGCTYSPDFSLLYLLP